jgi:hypothetical protein
MPALESHISLETIDALLMASDVKTQLKSRSLSFKGFVGETKIDITPSECETADGLRISEIIDIESVLGLSSLPGGDAMVCALNMSASHGALMIGDHGNLSIKSRISLFSGEPEKVIELYTGLIFFVAMIHTNAIQSALVDAWKLPVSKGGSLPGSSDDGVWSSDSFLRAVSMLENSGAFTNGDGDGFTSEIPWDPGAISATQNLMTGSKKRTSLLHIHREEHPNLGKGLFCRLDLPLKLNDSDAFKLATTLNQTESTAEDWPPFLGAWTSKPKSGRPTFVSFWPNMFAKVISLELITMWTAARARRVAAWAKSSGLEV